MALSISQDQLSGDRLRKALLGQDPIIARQMAFRAAVTAVLTDKLDLLRTVIDNKLESPRIRSLAVHTLYRLNAPEAEQILLRSSPGIEDERVLTAVAQSLGRIGTPAALDVVLDIRKRSRLAAAQADFAAALIAHRSGLPGYELPGPHNSPLLALPADLQREFTIARSQEEAVIVLHSLQSEPFGIQLSEEAIHHVRCGRNNWAIVLNAEVTETRGALLLKRKAIAGVLAYKSEESGRYSVAFVILTDPVGRIGEFEIKVHRTTGEQAFVGDAKMDGSSPRFQLASVARPGVFAIRVEGKLEGVNLPLTTRLSALRIHERRRPQRGMAP